MPTEKGTYIDEMFSRVFKDMCERGIDCPEVVWVDDWYKWQALLLRIVRRFWPQASLKLLLASNVGTLWAGAIIKLF